MHHVYCVALSLYSFVFLWEWIPPLEIRRLCQYHDDDTYDDNYRECASEWVSGNTEEKFGTGHEAARAMQAPWTVARRGEGWSGVKGRRHTNKEHCPPQLYHTKLSAWHDFKLGNPKGSHKTKSHRAKVKEKGRKTIYFSCGFVCLLHSQTLCHSFFLNGPLSASTHGN